MRLRYKAWAIPELKKNPRVIFDPLEPAVDWTNIFGDDRPLHLEIGCGWGGFLLDSAQQNPDINYIALEKEAGVLVYAVRKFDEAGADNLFSIRADADRLEEFFAEDSIDRIYLNFSNPWPARRHHRRRLTHPLFLEKYKRILKKEGDLRLKTDNLPFFEDSLKYLTRSGFRILEIDRDLPADRPGNIVTDYESKWRAMGIKINYLRAVIDADGSNIAVREK